MSLVQTIRKQIKQDLRKKPIMEEREQLKQAFEDREQLKQAYIEEREQLKLDFIELHQWLTQTFIEQRQNLTQALCQQYQSLRAMLPFKQAVIEERQPQRESVEFTAWIDIGNRTAPRKCTVSVAEDGTRIRVPDPAELPREFYLVLGADGKKRHCQLLWRSDEEVGISYLEPQDFGRVATFFQKPAS